MSFVGKHIGPNRQNVQKMLQYLGHNSKDNFIEKIIPKNITYNLNNFESIEEHKSLNEIKEIKNLKYKYLIGLEYNESVLPNVIKRNLLENPKWYTSYSPYQSEISQGRLESLFNYQTLITELTKLPISNCSLLDSGSACSEAMTMAYAYNKYKKNDFFIDKNLHPHLIEILKTKCNALDLNYEIEKIDNLNINDELFGVITSYPDTYGNIELNKELFKDLNKHKIPIITHNDLMSLMILEPPGNIGANISVGSTQNFGLPLWFGGPHSSFISCDSNFLRFIPGRIVGKTIDRNNNECFRLALQTREQHIRKDKALSNICTSQALLANTSAMYAINHGKTNLTKISNEIYFKTLAIKNILEDFGLCILNKNCYNTIVINVKESSIFDNLKKNGFYIRKIDNNKVGFTINEAFEYQDCVKLINLIKNCVNDNDKNIDESYFIKKKNNVENILGKNNLLRKDEFLSQEIFKESKNETFMLRYINSLADKDYSLVNGMIPLGSCTMKLNSSTQMTPLSFDDICNSHPYVETKPKIYENIINELSDYLLDITNMDAISFSPNSGAMGEYAGLLTIKKYHEKNNEEKRNICLIPYSAHGTNFASASMCNMKIIKFHDEINLDNFEKLCKDNCENLSCMMITYPNTYGVFNENIKKYTEIIHKYGGLVYMDGANMNAQTGLTSPGSCGADVCHLNIHKTFCIPHGGGGPGMGPICVNKKLEPYLPSNIYTNKNYSNEDRIGMVTNSQYSSASLLLIPYLYFKNMGSEGIKEASIIAILNANYLKFRLQDYYKIYSENDKGLVGHEFIIDLNEFKDIGINDKDIAKRLIDYGFHPPTMSWPVPNSLMIEPTESESYDELNRFINAMINIHKEIYEIREGKYSKENNVLVNSPHSFSDLTNWNFDYSIEKACFPLEDLKKNKFWPSNVRINDLHGDKNLILKY